MCWLISIQAQTPTTENVKEEITKLKEDIKQEMLVSINGNYEHTLTCYIKYVTWHHFCHFISEVATQSEAPGEQKKALQILAVLVSPIYCTNSDSH